MSGRELAMALGVSPSTPGNWARGTDVTLTPEMQRSVADFLRMSPLEVLDLAGYDVSEEVAAGATVGGSGASHKPRLAVITGGGESTEHQGAPLTAVAA